MKHMAIYLSISVMLLVSIFALVELQKTREALAEETEYREELEEEIVTVEAENKKLKTDNKKLDDKLYQVKKENRKMQDILYDLNETYKVVMNSEATSNMVVSCSSGLTADMFERAWENLGANNFAGSGKAFVKAEKETGVNALFLAGVSVLETAWGNSYLAQTRNNYFGWGAYDRNPLKYAKSFKSMEHSIMHVSERIERNYLNRGRETVERIGRRYATDPYWDRKVINAMRRILRASLKEKEEKLKQFG